MVSEIGIPTRERGNELILYTVCRELSGSHLRLIMRVDLAQAFYFVAKQVPISTEIHRFFSFPEEIVG